MCFSLYDWLLPFFTFSMYSNIEILNFLLTHFMMNGFTHHYHLGESSLIFRGFRCDFRILLYFLMKFPQANRIAPDGTPRSAASHLGLFCLPMSHIRDARLK